MTGVPSALRSRRPRANPTTTVATPAARQVKPRMTAAVRSRREKGLRATIMGEVYAAVRMIGSPCVMTRVCSKWADSARSRVLTVH